MKFTDLKSDEQLFLFTRIEEQSKKVHGESLSSIEAAINYLFLTNAGGAVATLSLLAATEGKNDKIGPFWALVFFCVGVGLVGVVKSFRVSYFAKCSKSWGIESPRFLAGEISWEDLNAKYETAAKEPTWPYVVGYSSFLCLVAGAAIGFYLLKSAI